jgi:murein L,D-transpeptidase YcbB/YkuD
MRRSVLALTAAFALIAAPSLPRRAPLLRIDINLPAFRLDAYVDDSLVRSMPIAPGMPAYKSPRGDYAITSIEWNPWWIPPASPWAKKEKVTPPGPANPMGRVKLNFSGLYFVHGSPFDASIGTAASHGCIRLHNADAIALARLAHHFGSPRMSEEALDRLATDTATRRVALELPVPIRIRYDRAEVRGESVFVYRDVYGLSTRPLSREVMELLAARGIETVDVDTARVGRLTRGIARRGNAAALSELGIRHHQESPR